MTSSAERARADSPAGVADASVHGRVPDFFLVGHSKSGTTALYEMLRAHPQIFMPEMKEPIFFAGELPREAHRYTAPRTLAEYLALFARAEPGQRVGEASASYLRSDQAARRIAELRPDARIVAILREPASFLRSFHLQCVQAHYESERDLAKALALEDERRRGRRIPRRSRWPQELLYSQHVRYVEQLRRFEEQFPPEQMLVLIYDDFRADNEDTVRRVLRLLGVEEHVPLRASEANPTVAIRSQTMDDLLHRVSHGQGTAAAAVKRAALALTPQRARRRLLQVAERRLVYAPPPEPDEALMRELRRRFKPEVQALSEHLGRDLVLLWGYQDVD